MVDRYRPANSFSDPIPGTARPVGAPPPAGGSQNSDITEQAQQTISHVADRASSVVTAQIERQKERAANGLDSVAGALEQAATRLEDDKVGLHEYVDGAVSRVRALSSYLRENDVAEVIDDAEDFAKRQPVLVIGGAFLLGFLGARFMASSRPATPRSRRAPLPPRPADRPRIPAVG